MSQPNNILDFYNIDVGKIQNLVFSARTQKEHKTYSTLFDVFYALIGLGVLLIALMGNVFSSISPLSYIAILTFPAMNVYTLLYSKSFVKVISLLSAPLLSGILFALTNTPIRTVVNSLFVYLLCILTSAYISLCVMKKRSKLYIFVGISVTAGVVMLCNLAFFHIYSNGTLSVYSIATAIDTFFENLYNTYSLAYDNLLSSLGITDLKEIAAVKQTLQNSLSAVKLVLPSILALISMLYSFIVVAVFSRFARLFKIDVFVCIMDEFWTYRLPSITLKMYDIVVFAFIIGMFVNVPRNISATIVNLLIILTPIIFVTGLKNIYTYIVSKGKSKTKGKIICTLILVAAFALMGMWAFYIISSVGIVFIASKDKFEKTVVGEKMLFDEQVLKDEHLCKTDVPKQKNETSDTDQGSDKHDNLE